MKKLLLFCILLSAAPSFAQNGFSSNFPVPLLPGSYTVSSGVSFPALPTPVTKVMAIITDGNPDCQTGGGTNVLTCIYDGSAWQVIGRVSGSIVLNTGGVLKWGSDTGISRGSAGVIDIGTGAQGSIAGEIDLAKLLSKNIGNVYFADRYCPVLGNFNGCISAALAAIPASAVLYVPTNLGTFTETTNNFITLAQSVHIVCDGKFSGGGIAWDPGDHGLFETNNSSSLTNDIEIDHCPIANTHTRSGTQGKFSVILVRTSKNVRFHDNYVYGGRYPVQTFYGSRNIEIYNNTFTGIKDGMFATNTNYYSGGCANTTYTANGATAVLTLGCQTNAQVNDVITVAGCAPSSLNSTNALVTAATATTISYANTTNSSGTSSCTVAVWSYNNNIHDNIVLDSTGTGQQASFGAPHIIEGEDMVDSSTMNNNWTVASGSYDGTNDINATFFQSYQNHSGSIRNNRVIGNHMAVIPAAPTGALGGIVMDASGTYYNSLAENNIIVGAANCVQATSVVAVSNFHYSGNTCTDTGPAFLFSAASGSVAVTGTLSDNTVDINTNSGANAGRCIDIEHISNTLVTGNYLRKCGQQGIYISAGSNHIVTNNQVVDAGQAGATNAMGIYILAATQNSIGNRVENNSVFDDQLLSTTGVATMAYGIRLDAGAVGTYLGQNDVWGMTARSQNILNNGTGTIRGDQQGIIFGSQTFTALATAGTPTITPTCSASCTNTWTYQVVAFAGSQNSAHSASGSTALGAGTLTTGGTNYNSIATVNVNGSDHCYVYRTVSGGTPATTGFIGDVQCGQTFIDNGEAGDAAAASNSNNSGLLNATTIKDSNGNPFLLSSATASAVDSVTVTNAATATLPTVTIAASGSDSNVNLALNALGTGTVTAGGMFENSTNTVFVTGDFTDANSASLQAITGLSVTFPANKAVNAAFHCMLLYSQATNVAGDQFGIASTVTAPTQINAGAMVATNTTAFQQGQLTGLTTTTPTAIVTFQPAVTTVLTAYLDGMLEEPSNASAPIINWYVLNGTAADVIVIKRGSYCTLYPR